MGVGAAEKKLKRDVGKWKAADMKLGGSEASPIENSRVRELESE